MNSVYYKMLRSNLTHLLIREENDHAKPKESFG